MATWSPEKAFAEFKARLPALAAVTFAANEAKTRMQIIDEFLFQILGWNKVDVDPEKYVRLEGYADYAFNENGSTCMVIEAKKIDVGFILPENKLDTEPVPFSLLAKECPAARNALIQVIGYAASLGARYIGITNGHQWLFTLTYIEGQSIEDRLVIVFDSYKSIENRFRVFWNCFSQDGVSNNLIYDQFFESRKKPAPVKISRSIPGYPVASKRNVYINELSFVLQILWDTLSKIENSSKFIVNCYVQTKADEHLIAYARNLLSNRINADKAYIDSTVEDAQSIKNVLSISSNEKPFVILGDVGHGKSTFLHYLRYVAVRDILQNYVQLDIDFVDRPDHVSEIASYIYKEIESQFMTQLNIDIYSHAFVQGVLYIEFQRFKDSARYQVLSGDEKAQRMEEKRFVEERIADHHSYFTSLFRYLKRGMKKSIAIYFDNLDRRNPAIQEEAFLKASAIARDWECIVFICLRPSTFYESISAGVLDALAPKTFAIGAPDLSLVLKRRFEFARKLALGEEVSEQFQQLNSHPDISLKLPSVAKIFASCEFSTRKGSDAILMLSALSNGDMRLLIDLTRSVLTGGHLDTRKIMHAIQHDGNYLLPDFEAVKTLLYGDYDQYDPVRSLFINLFDVFHSDKKEHFLKILALDFLNKTDNKDGSMGYVQEHELATHLQSFYFDPITVKKHLEVLRAGKLIEFIQTRHDSETETRIRITTRGRYQVGNLVTSFQYLDAIIIDTPILNSEIIRDLKHGIDIDQRINRTRIFLTYLNEALKILHDPHGQEICRHILDNARADVDSVESGLKATRSRAR